MTTNLAESINFVLKKTINLPISSLVMTTYPNYNKFLTNRDRKVASMIIVGHVYSEMEAKTLEDT